MTQLPDTDLIKDVGVVGYLLILMAFASISGLGWFMHRMASSMDRMAKAQEAGPPVLSELKELLSLRLDSIDNKLDSSIELSRENVEIAKLWKTTEAPERVVRKTI